MRFFKIIFVFFILLTILSCVPKREDKKNDAFLSKEEKIGMPKYARGFQIFTEDGNKIIRIFDPWKQGDVLQEFCLIPRGETSPKNHKNRLVLSIPVKSIAITSLDNIGFLDELNALPQVKAITDANRLYNKYLNQRMEEGKLVNLGPAVNLNVEKLIMADVDIIFSTTYNAGSKTKNILSKSGSISFFNMDWMEQSPLGRAEWVKVIGALLDKSEMADSLFNQIERNYLKIRDKSDKEVLKPKVIIGSGYKGIWYMPGGKSFKAIMLRDAGASYRWSKDTSTGSLALSFEKVFQEQRDADIWLEIPYHSYEEVLAVDHRYGLFKAFRDSMIFNNFGQSNGMANNYWEKGLCRPDLILRDLVNILHPESSNHKLLFYNKL